MSREHPTPEEIAAVVRYCEDIFGAVPPCSYAQNRARCVGCAPEIEGGFRDHAAAIPDKPK